MKTKKQLTLYDVRERRLKEQRRKRLAAKACFFGGARAMVNYYAARIDKKLKKSIVNGTTVISIASLLRSRA